MEKTLQYVVNENGETSAVLVSIDAWNDMNEKYNRLVKKIRVLTGIRKGLEEVEAARKNGKELRSLKDFLNESNS